MSQPIVSAELPRLWCRKLLWHRERTGTELSHISRVAKLPCQPQLRKHQLSLFAGPGPKQMCVEGNGAVGERGGVSVWRVFPELGGGWRLRDRNRGRQRVVQEREGQTGEQFALTQVWWSSAAFCVSVLLAPEMSTSCWNETASVSVSELTFLQRTALCLFKIRELGTGTSTSDVFVCVVTVSRCIVN